MQNNPSGRHKPRALARCGLIQAPLTSGKARTAAALAAIAWCAGIRSTAARAAPGDIHNLGALGGASSQGYGINASGQVAGSADGFAFRYDGTPGAGGIMHRLGSLPGETGSSGAGLNASGQVAGSAPSPLGDGLSFHAFRYDGTPAQGGVIHNLGTLGGYGSLGSGINDAGQIAGSSTLRGDEPTRAFRYDGTPGQGGVMRDLGTLPGGTDSGGSAINNAGQVVGYSSTAVRFTNHAFRYDGTPGAGGVMHDLGTLGGTESVAWGINGSGQVVGSSTRADSTTRAFRYDGTPGEGGVMLELDLLGGQSSVAYGINDAAAAVGRAQVGDGGYLAALWRPDRSVVNLDAWLDAINPAAGAYWSLTEARGINSAGQVTGWGWYDDGAEGLEDGERAFLLDASGAIPEPGGLALLGFAAPALLRRRRLARPVSVGAP
jgi:MYXO-CTERM domain-containing protein